MPTLPLVINRANLPSVGYQRATPFEYGAESFRQLGIAGEELQRINDAADMVAVQQALENRDKEYRQKKLDMAQNADQYANMRPQDFTKQWDEEQQAGDRAALENLPARTRQHAQILFSRLGTAQFNQAFGDYSKLFTANGKAQYLRSADESTMGAINAKNDDERLYHEANFVAVTRTAMRSGFIDPVFGQEQLRNFPQNVLYQRQLQRAIGDDVTPGDPLGVGKDIHEGKLNELMPEKRFELHSKVTTLANESITAANRTREQQQRQFDSDWNQAVYFNKESDTQLMDRLGKANAAGLVTDADMRTKMADIDKRLTRDTPQQESNYQKMAADFSYAGYKPENLARTRQQAELAKDRGELGPEGFLKISREFERARELVEREAKADARLNRAMADRIPASEKYNSALDVINKQFDPLVRNYDNDYKAAVQELMRRAGTLADPKTKEVPGDVAREIVGRLDSKREKEKTIADQKAKEKAAAAKEPPQALKLKAMDDLVGTKKGK